MTRRHSSSGHLQQPLHIPTEAPAVAAAVAAAAVGVGVVLMQMHH